MNDFLLNVATGRHIYATYFLLTFMVVAPTAFFTDYVWLDHIAWCMLIILGVFIFITGVVTLHEGRASHKWPMAAAELQSAGLKSQSNKGSVSYAPRIQCLFKVHGKSYNGTEYDFSASFTRKEKAQAKVDEVKAMRPLVVHYKPADPTINVIRPGVHFVHYIRLILGFGTVLIAGLSWLGVITYH